MRYLRRRVLISIAIIIVSLNLDFLLPRIAPGNYAEIVAIDSRTPGVTVTALTARFGLNQPFLEQYRIFLSTIFSWPPTFGTSYTYFPTSVSTLFVGRLPWTLFLMITSFALAIVIAYFLTSQVALRRGGKLEVGSMYGALFLHSTPIYWTGLIGIWVFGVELGWLPAFGNLSINPGAGLDYLHSVLSHAVLPIVVLTASIFGEVYLVLRSSTQQIFGSDFVTAAKARGLYNNTVAFTYILRNSLIPLVSLLSFSLASIVSRLIIIEAVFGYPGVGDLFVDAVLTRDYPTLAGCLLLLTLLVVAGGLIGDFVLTRLDPRLKR